MAQRSKGLWANIRTIFWGVVIAIVIRSLVVQPFTIPSGSMIPTLLVGDYVVVSKYAYGYSRFSFPFSPDLFGGGRVMGSLPDRGDVVVFRLPQNNSVDYIKRAIGLPGDRVQMRDGQLMINGAPVPKKLVGCADAQPNLSNCRYQVFEEVLGNHPSLMMDSGRTRVDNTREFLVPEGHVFFMGDNRDNSEDSRLGVGFVPQENLVGQADLVLFSIDDSFQFSDPSSYARLFRWDRFFTLVD
jgi:signal peptidase I, bacterial type